MADFHPCSYCTSGSQTSSEVAQTSLELILYHKQALNFSRSTITDHYQVESLFYDWGWALQVFRVLYICLQSRIRLCSKREIRRQFIMQTVRKEKNTSCLFSNPLMLQQSYIPLEFHFLLFYDILLLTINPALEEGSGNREHIRTQMWPPCSIL